MTKRFSAFLISVIIILTAVFIPAVCAAETEDIIIDGVTYTIEKGGTVTYSAYLKSSEDIKSGSFSVLYPSDSVKIKSVTSPYAKYDAKDGDIKFSLIDGKKDFSVEKTLFEIEFTVTASGDTDFKLNVNSLSGSEGVIDKDKYKIKENIFLTNPSYTAPEESSKGEVKNIKISWQIGRITLTGGIDAEETTKRYYITGYISSKDFNNVDITVLDDTYRYNLFFYDKDKKYISAYENINPPTLNVNDTVKLPQNTAYVRLLVCRSGDLGGVEDNILDTKSKIYFTFLNIKEPEEPEFVPLKQGIFTEGRIAVSTGKDVDDDRNIYYVTDFIYVKQLSSIDVVVKDSTYCYNIFWYNSSKSFLGSEENVNPPTLNKTKSYNIYTGAYYCRFEVSRKSALGGIEDGALIGNDKIYFNLVSKNGENIIATTESLEASKKAEAADKKAVVKKSNPIKVTILNKKVKAKTLKKKSVTLKVIKVKKAKGKVTYKKLKGSSKRITLKTKTGKIKIKKGTVKKTYKIKIRVKAKGNSKYKSKSITKTIKVKVI